jgi:NAD(P)-dependent dehydrogenase (short-subunit alcohol dehydrogenase family)
VSAHQYHRFDPHWYSSALRQIADARWKHERLTVITGAAGVGKTTLCRRVADRGTRTVVISISEPQPTGHAFLKQLAYEIGALSQAGSPSAEITNQDLQFVTRKYLVSLASLKTECVIIVDNAHCLQADATDEIRALLDSLTDRGASTHFILVGQPQSETVGDAAAASAPGSSVAIDLPPNRRRLMTTVATVAACAIVWFAFLQRRPPAATATPVGTHPAASDATTATRLEETPSVQLPKGPGWIAEVIRRADTLAQEPDVKTLIALRSAVQTNAPDADGGTRQVESVLRRLDDSLVKAQKRQLEIDRRRLLDSTTTNR